MISLIRESGAFSSPVPTQAKQVEAPKQNKVYDIERILFFPIPQPVKVEPFFTITPPEPYEFPLQNTSLEGIQLVDSHFPDQVNNRLDNQIRTRIQRISRFHDKICAMGRGKGLVLGDKYLDVPGISAYAYGPQFLVVGFDNCSITIYSMDLKPIKEFKNFTKKKLTMIRLLRVPRSFEGLILLTSTGRDLVIHRLENSFFSKLSIKLQADIMNGLQQPITHILDIPMSLQLLLYKDVSYQDTTLMAIMCLDKIIVVRFLNYRLTFDKFWDVVYERRWTENISVTSCSWGQAKITSIEKQIMGERVVLTYSFGKNLYLAILNPNNQYLDGETKVKYEWIQSHPFTLDANQSFVFCQFMKKNELMSVTDENRIIIFHTENAELFDRSRNVSNTPCLVYKFDERLKGQRLQNVQQINKVNTSKITEEEMEDLPPELLELLSQVPIVTYAQSFSHYYDSNEVYFLTERHFGIYQYKNWKQICQSLKTQQKYQAAMRFLIALYLKVNRFDLGIHHSEGSYNYDLSQYSKILAIQFLEKKLSNLIQMPQLLQKFNVSPLISIPVEFLVRMNEFSFLFEVLRGKIISYTSQDAFYRVLQPFAEHGRIKFIPEGQLRDVLRYYINKGDTDIVERMAIHFDVEIIDRGIVIQQLIDNHLVVSLAYVCTQGNEIQFLTPFAKYWSMSDNEKRKKNMEQAEFYARRALYYVKICLQRNMALKSYSYQKYASMIDLLTSNFFTKKMLMGLMKIDMEWTLDALSYYFSIQISGIINESAKFKLPDISVQTWINQREGNHNIELLLSGIYTYCSEEGMDLEQKKLFYVLLSRIIIYKTVKFTNQKYLDILSFLINNYSVIEKIKYGLDADQIQNYQQLCSRQEATQIMSSGYISKLLELVNQEFPLKKSLAQLFECSRRVPLTELQAHICLIQGNYKASIQIYLRGRQSSKVRVFEFLTDTFHNFLISKNKKESSKLMDSLRQYVPTLISLSAVKSRDLIQQYMPSFQEELILGLQNQPAVQLEYLEHIIPSMTLQQKSTLRYIQLMCKYKPNQLIDSFKKYPHLPIEQSLEICRKHQVFDCMQFLYERMGDIEQSVKIAALRIDKLFLQRFNSVDIDEYQYYSQIAQILNNAIQTCVNNRSEEMWAILLDSMIGIFNKYRQRIEYNQEIIVFYQINAKILNFMARYCSIDYLAELFETRYNGLDMGGSMKKSFIDMLNNFSYSENILFSARTLNRDMYWNALFNRCKASLKAYLPSRWCQNCQQSIQRVSQAVCYPCKHTYHKQCVVKDSSYCLACLRSMSCQLEFYLTIPNPHKPPIKIQKLFNQAEKIQLQMKQKFKVHDYEQGQRNKDAQIAQFQLSSKLDRFKRFDGQVDLIEFTNNQVQKEIELEFKNLKQKLYT